jgi:hypothetical protein
VFGVVRTSGKQLKVFWKQLENIYFCQFSSFDLSHKIASVSVSLLPGVNTVESISWLRILKLNSVNCVAMLLYQLHLLFLCQNKLQPYPATPYIKQQQACGRGGQGNKNDHTQQ